jgi:integrase
MGIIKQARKIRQKSNYLFPSTKNYKKPAGNDALYHAVVKLFERTCAEPWTPKDIRAKFKTRGGEIGLTKEIRDRVQNHAMTDVSPRYYDHYDYMSEKLAALEAWESAVIDKLFSR